MDIYNILGEIAYALNYREKTVDIDDNSFNYREKVVDVDDDSFNYRGKTAVAVGKSFNEENEKNSVEKLSDMLENYLRDINIKILEKNRMLSPEQISLITPIIDEQLGEISLMRERGG